MFEFFRSSTNQKQARAVLAKIASNKVLEDLHGQDRISARTPMLKMEMAIPSAGKRFLYEDAFPVLLSDISAGGVSLVHHEPIRGELLLRVTESSEMHYLLFASRFCRELGYGYWQTGLECLELGKPSPSEEAILADRVTVFEEYAAQQRALNEETESASART